MCKDSIVAHSRQAFGPSPRPPARLTLPVFLHCRQGQDRTGIVVAAYRMKVDGWSLADAEAEMRSFGFHDIWMELKEFIREYAKGLGK